MPTWKSTNQIGIAICNYGVETVQHRHLPLLIGEVLLIQEECEHWFYGYSLTTDQQRSGIFPKNHVLLQQNETDKNNKLTFGQEIILTLHEWLKAWKRIVIDGDREKYQQIRELILDIVGKYNTLKSGKLTSSEIKKLKIEIIDKIDLGNKHLDLDLIIRDAEGNVINPFETSIIQYFQAHWEKTQKLRAFFRNSNDSDGAKQDKYSSHHSNHSGYDCSNFNNYNDCYNFCVTLSNFICRIKQDMIIYMSIYDANNNKFITENYVVKWDRTGFVREVEKINNIRVVFTDFSANDLYHKNRKLYLVCQVIRVGTMHIDHERSNKLAMKVGHSTLKMTNIDELKRPCGIAVYDLSEVINNPNGDRDEEKEVTVPLIQYSEKDSLDSLLRKVIRDSKDPGNKEQGFILSTRMIVSHKMQLLDKYRLYYAQYPSYIARKIGFRDIILPEDVRNDLYLTLVCGDFHKGSKKSEHNIEVMVKVVDEDGTTLENCLSVDSHNAMDSLYRSVVYYHEDRPKWMETIKVVLPIEKFTNAHLKFIFKHRSSNENKDKNEKPFAISFIRLMNKDGTTLANDIYKPFIYKIDQKKYNETDISYLSLPSRDEEIRKNDSEPNDLKLLPKKNYPSNMYTLSPRDVFTIAINICSTKLAQNIKILGLLNWKEKKDSLEEILKNVQQLEGGEIMKFLHDVLDALFEIWMDPDTPSRYDRQIFDALVYIIKHLLQEKYIHFQEILNDYIEKHFSATLIHTKLVESFKYYIENPDSSLSYQTVTSTEFIFKFIIRSRNLYEIINADKDKLDFEQALDGLFDLFTKLMDPSEFSESSENVIKVRMGILKYFPKVINNVLNIYDERKLTFWIIKLITNIPVADLSVQKLACIHEIVESELFRNYHECRRKLLPVINVHLQTALLMVIEEDSPRNEKLETCLTIISDALEILIDKDIRTIKHDIFDFVQILLTTLIETFLYIQTKPNESAHRYKLWSIILALLYQMTDYHYYEFFDKSLRMNNDFENFLKDLLRTFDFASEGIFPQDWSDMINAQNIVILKAMKRVINYTKEKINFYEYSLELWNQLFLTSIKFITQRSLAIENFSNRKRSRLLNAHQDIRLEMVVLIRSLWYNLANHKTEFVPILIGPLLEVALLPVLTIRKDTIVIFFDMFLCCFEKASITRNEMLTQLDSLITAGKGDEEFQRLIAGIFLESSVNHVDEIKEVFEKFVLEISEQIEKLLIYRDVIKNEDNYEVSMSCIIELLDFYDRINRKELYINYLYKLYDLHLKLENFNEAAYTLCKHSVLLEWSDKPLDELLRSERYQIYNSHRELKEKLYSDIIENFNKGHLWEAGIVHCKELVQQYENEIYDYVKLSELFEKMATFYKLIISSVRIEPEYFHVAYYGNGYPKYFQNKSFIYRGKSYERLIEFTKRLQKQFPSSQLLDKLDVSKSELSNSQQQYLSIFPVEPKVSEEVKNKFLRNLVDERIIKYYQYNEISEFIFSRKLIRNDKNEKSASNEFACMWIERSEYKTAFSLPGISHRSEVIDKITFTLNPLENAIDTMEKMNEKTRMIIFRYMMDDDNSNPLHNLLMHIKGIVSSDVQGGVSKYEEAFFEPINENQDDGEEAGSCKNYRQEDLDKLKTLIANQIPLVDLALKIAYQKQKQHVVNQSMDGLYQYIVESFEKMRDDVEMKYGRSDLPMDMKKIIENHHKIQRLTMATMANRTINNNNHNNKQHRNSMDGTMTLTKRTLFSRSNTGTNTLTNTLRFRRKEPRRLNSISDSNSVYASNMNISQTQWYTDHNKKSTGNISYMSDNVVVEQQHQQLQLQSSSSKESRSSRISSRPNSGQFSSRTSIQSQLSLYCPQSTSSMSLDDDQEELPPPLPGKKTNYDTLKLEKS